MILMKDNIERIAEDKVKISKLKADGFKEVTLKKKAEHEKQEEPPKDLEDMTVPELRTLAKEKGIEGTSSLNRDDLLSALKEVD